MPLTRKDKIEWLLCNLEEISKSYYLSIYINNNIAQLDLNYEKYSPYRHMCNVLIADIAIRWCKVFGTNNEEMHWKKFINETDYSAFKENLLTTSKMSSAEFTSYWEKMKEARDHACAHFTFEYVGKEFPYLENAIECAAAAYSYFVDELINKYGINRSKIDLKLLGQHASKGFTDKLNSNHH